MRVHTLLRRGDGVPVATGEYFYLHADQAAGEVTAMPPGRWLAVDALLSAHASLGRPGHLGRGLERAGSPDAGPRRPAGSPRELPCPDMRGQGRDWCGVVAGLCISS